MNADSVVPVAGSTRKKRIAARLEHLSTPTYCSHSTVLVPGPGQILFYSILALCSMVSPRPQPMLATVRYLYIKFGHIDHCKAAAFQAQRPAV